QALMIFVQLH
ncbi:cell envelope integrity inner membrane protein TolA, partial [Haemophilus influenzae]